jgi:hypothetical protein
MGNCGRKFEVLGWDDAGWGDEDNGDDVPVDFGLCGSVTVVEDLP